MPLKNSLVERLHGNACRYPVSLMMYRDTELLVCGHGRESPGNIWHHKILGIWEFVVFVEEGYNYGHLDIQVC